MIYTNSRYVNQSVLRVQGSDGQSRPTLYRKPTAPARRFLHYEAVYGDRMDLLASRFYQDPTLWWVIADANPEVFFPGTIAPGSILRIPQH